MTMDAKKIVRVALSATRPERPAMFVPLGVACLKVSSVADETKGNGEPNIWLHQINLGRHLDADTMAKVEAAMETAIQEDSTQAIYPLQKSIDDAEAARNGKQRNSFRTRVVEQFRQWNNGAKSKTEVQVVSEEEVPF